MAVSLHTLSVGTFHQILTSVSGFLDKGLAHCRDAGTDPNEFVEARLYADMAPLRFQIVSVAHHSAGAIEAVRTGEFRPPSPGTQDYSGLQSLVTDTIAQLDAIEAREIDELGEREVHLRLGERTIPFAAQDFLLSFSLPNFHFHATTAYDILRSRGVKIGKRDYLGRLLIKQ